VLNVEVVLGSFCPMRGLGSGRRNCLFPTWSSGWPDSSLMDAMVLAETCTLFFF
jgi:hypothetical protein